MGEHTCGLGCDPAGQGRAAGTLPSETPSRGLHTTLSSLEAPPQLLLLAQPHRRLPRHSLGPLPLLSRKPHSLPNFISQFSILSYLIQESTRFFCKGSASQGVQKLPCARGK